MNIIKGIDRIVLILAIIAIVPGIILGVKISYDSLTTVYPEWIEWAKNKPEFNIIYEKDGITKQLYPNPPVKYFRPHPLKMIAGGMVGAPLSFLFVFFGLKGLTRGIRRLSIWIIEGFKG